MSSIMQHSVICDEMSQNSVERLALGLLEMLNPNTLCLLV